MWLRAHSPQPIARRGRLGKFLESQHPAQCLIILKVATIIQMKAAFMLHQDEGLDEFRGSVPTITFRLGKVLINTFSETQGVH